MVILFSFLKLDGSTCLAVSAMRVINTISWSLNKWNVLTRLELLSTRLLRVKVHQNEFINKSHVPIPCVERPSDRFSIIATRRILVNDQNVHWINQKYYDTNKQTMTFYAIWISKSRLSRETARFTTVWRHVFNISVQNDHRKKFNSISFVSQKSRTLSKESAQAAFLHLADFFIRDTVLKNVSHHRFEFRRMSVRENNSRWAINVYECKL